MTVALRECVMYRKEGNPLKRNSIVLVTASYLVMTLLAITLTFIFPAKLTYILGSFFCLMILWSVLLIVLLKKKRGLSQQQEQEALSALINSINAMVIVWREDFSYIKVNNNLRALTGYSRRDLRDIRNLKKLLPKQVFDNANLDNLVNEHDMESTICCRNGSPLNAIWNTSVISTDEKGKTFMSIGLDYTKEAKLQHTITAVSKDLERTESELSLSMELSEIGIMLRKIGSNDLFISNQLCKALGLRTEKIDIEDFRVLIHPAEQILFDVFCEADGKNTEIDTVHNIEIRILNADRTYHWYNFRYKLSVRGESGEQEIGGAVIDISKEKEKDSIIEKMAYIDEITQIYNRNKFMFIGQETYDCSFELGISYWLIVLDIDKFHIINDTCGYQNGNKLLREVATIINRCSTAIGFCARIGGDNFAIIIKENDDPQLPVKTIQSIQQNLSNLAENVFANQTISCSAGYCKVPGDGKNFANCLDHAEFALSVSDGTRGSITRYDAAVHDIIIEGTSLEHELSKAIYNDELVLYYQPKINLANGEIIGMEALIRWIKPDGTIIPPSYFIPVAEHSLLITKISDFVLYEACRQNKEWQDMGLPKFTVSINLTSVDFYQTNVKESITEVLEQTGLEPEYLEVELTESLALKDIEQAIRQMKDIKDIGVKLSMDDFGTGYSSLSYIQSLPITLLKLDRSFIMYLEEDEVSREIVSAVIRIAKAKHIETIAEGIETIGQAQILRESGCDHAQGFFFGKPMPADEIEDFIRQSKKKIGFSSDLNRFASLIRKPITLPDKKTHVVKTQEEK